MSKEEIYDSKINPLMAQILAICKNHKIAMVASFATPSDTDPNILCTSALLQKKFEPPAEFLKALSIIVPTERSPLMITTRHADGSTTMTAVLG